MLAWTKEQSVITALGQIYWINQVPKEAEVRHPESYNRTFSSRRTTIADVLVQYVAPGSLSE